jgi:hypothetical protein
VDEDGNGEEPAKPRTKTMTRCTLCKKPLKATTTTHPVSVAPKKIVKVEIPAQRCIGCDEVFTDYDDVKKAEFAVALEVISAGQANGVTFRFLRHVLGMRAKDLAVILGTTPETLSRWENGHAEVDRNTWLVVALLVLGRVNQDDRAERALEALAKPRPISERVKIAS